MKQADTTADRRRGGGRLTPDNKTLLSGRTALLVYMTAAGTGLRQLELVRLQWRDVAIDGPGQACLELRAERRKPSADVVPGPFGAAAHRQCGGSTLPIGFRQGAGFLLLARGRTGRYQVPWRGWADCRVSFDASFVSSWNGRAFRHAIMELAAS